MHTTCTHAAAPHRTHTGRHILAHVHWLVLYMCYTRGEFPRGRCAHAWTLTWTYCVLGAYCRFRRSTRYVCALIIHDFDFCFACVCVVCAVCVLGKCVCVKGVSGMYRTYEVKYQMLFSCHECRLIYIYIYIYIYTHTHTHAHKQTCKPTYMHTYTHISLRRKQILLLSFMWHIHVYIHTYIYINTHVHLHTQKQADLSSLFHAASGPHVP